MPTWLPPDHPAFAAEVVEVDAGDGTVDVARDGAVVRTVDAVWGVLLEQAARTMATEASAR